MANNYLSTSGAIPLNTSPLPTIEAVWGIPNAVSLNSAALTRAQWNEWQQTGAPLEEWLQTQTSYANPGMVQELASKALNTSNQAFGQTGQQSLQHLRDMGAPMTAAESASRQRSLSVGQSAAAVDAANRIVQRVQARDVEIATGTPNSSGVNTGIRTNNQL
jgi:hypothetical protein